MSMSATDLRELFAIAFQPSIVANADLLAKMFDGVASTLVIHKVSEARIKRAAEAVGLNHMAVTVLLQYVRSEQLSQTF